MRLHRRLAALALAGLLFTTALAGCAPAPKGGDTPPEESAQAAPQKVNAPSAARDGFRAVWVATVYNLDYPDKATTDVAALKAQADDILENSAEMGMNAVILQVRPSCDALYPSELFPWSSYLTGDQNTAPAGGFDPMAYWVEKAHALGLELHAWVNPFRVTKGGQAEYDGLADSNPARQHPEWVVRHTENNVENFYLNPGIPEVRELVIQGAEELVRNYDIDGIHLDDYFYPGKTFADEAAYAQYGGGFSNLGDWRRSNVNLLIQELDQRLHAIDPELSFGVSPSGVWADKSHQSAGSTTTGNYESYYAAYADSRKWVQEGWVDYICPQIYWPIGHAKLDYETIARWWTDTVEGTGVKLYIGMADYQADKDDPEDPWYGLDAIKAQLKLNRELGVAGEAHFRYKFLAVNSHMRDLYIDWYAQTPGGGEEPEVSGSFLSRLSEADRNHWAAAYYGKLGDMGVVTGYPDGTYRPYESVERSSMAALVYRAMPLINGVTLSERAGGDLLPDVADTWAEGYIGALCAAGYLDAADYPDGFGQEQPMTRLEVVKLLVRALGYADDGSVTATRFPDVTEDYYYVAKGEALGIIEGTPEGLFLPSDGVDRGSAAAMLSRAMEIGR
ncbi:family 10 glycosylhydrolase [Pseudoflavonifractor phocaeensis]|uniref:family 10 glycosylhydrolase n=1 Tax=Pseudoflavonifractor phocaeensis TaxID=1870988 RepID=UPI002109F56E|nr:family 10 glycosylhydrolase [Pseudoflavonifractor phocaeensis]MCQ4865653.1 family 10 glycosylhydrolase [Pseudoflavonifractor phocaeensis]